MIDIINNLKFYIFPNYLLKSFKFEILILNPVNAPELILITTALLIKISMEETFSNNFLPL